VAAAAATGIQVGSAMVATRVVVDQAGPASLALLRYAIGFLCLLPVALAMPRPAFAARDLAPIALLGITQFGILIALLNHGLRFVPSARAAAVTCWRVALRLPETTFSSRRDNAQRTGRPVRRASSAARSR